MVGIKAIHKNLTYELYDTKAFKWVLFNDLPKDQKNLKIFQKDLKELKGIKFNGIFVILDMTKRIDEDSERLILFLSVTFKKLKFSRIMFVLTHCDEADKREMASQKMNLESWYKSVVQSRKLKKAVPCTSMCFKRNAKEDYKDLEDFLNAEVTKQMEFYLKNNWWNFFQILRNSSKLKKNNK